MRLTSVLVMLILVLPGCASAIQPPPPVVRTPLENDPEDPIKLSRWWSDGERLLRLDPDGGYVLYESLNRYDRPRDRGHWTRTSYAVVHLSPYETLQPRRIRVAITRINRTPALEIEGFRPMVAIGGPPVVLEDELIGTWRGDAGTLRLDESLQYVWTPARPSGPPFAVTGHRGNWDVAGTTIMLTPQPGDQHPHRFELVTAGDERSLLADGIVLRPTES